MEQSKYQSLWSSKRLIIAILLVTNILVNYIDRSAVSVAAPLISKEFGWDPAVMGWVFGAFVWAYVAFLIPSGWLSDRFGPRKVQSWAVGFWSLVIAATSLVTSFPQMIMARMALGVGEAASYPNGGKVIRYWFPAKERGVASAFLMGGTALGPAIALPFIAYLISSHGWRPSFVILGGLGFIWLIFWLKVYRLPEDATWLSADEKKYILDNTDAVQTKGTNEKSLKITGIISQIASQKTFWGIALGFCACSYAQYFIFMWLPTYLVQARGMTLLKAGIFASIPYFVGFLAAMCFGMISDRILTPEKLQKGKRNNQYVTFLLLTSIIVFANYVESAYVALALITAALACITCCQTIVLALINDVTKNPRITATVVSMVLTCSNAMGIFSSVITGYIVRETGSFTNVFLVVGAVIIIGVVLCYSLVGRPLEYKED